MICYFVDPVNIWFEIALSRNKSVQKWSSIWMSIVCQGKFIIHDDDVYVHRDNMAGQSL